MEPSHIITIENTIERLPIEEQFRLLERLTDRLRKTERPEWDGQLAAMATDPEIQREIKEIGVEFETADLDGLGAE